MTWQDFLIAYGAIGLVTAIVLMAHNHFITLRDSSDFVREILREHGQRNYSKWKVPVEYFVDHIFGPISAAFIGAVIWPLLVGLKLKERWFREPKKKAWALERKHLVERHDLAELEAREHVTDPLGAVPDLPFGHLNAAWERFKQNLTPGDEVWSFSEPCEVFGEEGIRNGYAILHNREIGTSWVTDYRDIDEVTPEAGSRYSATDVD